MYTNNKIQTKERTHTNVHECTRTIKYKQNKELIRMYTNVHECT